MGHHYSLVTLIWATCLVAAFFNAVPARAETAKEFQVSATIAPGCAVDGIGTSGPAGNVGTLDFGQDVAWSTATHTASLVSAQNITLRCTSGTELEVTVNGGLHAQSNQRKMRRLGPLDQRIEYKLYSDAAMNSEIEIGGHAEISVTPTDAQDIKIPIYAHVTLTGTTDPGTYTDTIQITLTW